MKVRLNENNPRILKDDKFKKLCQSIKEFPKMLELRPIIVDDTGLILGGNMRFRALQELKMPLKDEWVKVAESLTAEEQRRFIVEDNVGFGDWDWDILSSEYEKEELEDWGMDVDKWAEDEVVEDEVVEDEVPEVTENPVSKLGEVYKLGRHRLMCGDSTKIEDVEKLMDGKKADMVFTDMPYGIDKDGIENDNLKGSDFDNFNDEYISILPVNDDCGFVCYHSTRTFNPTINSAIRNGWKFEKMLFFNRPDKFPVHTWNGWMMTSQAILLFSKGKPKYNKVHPAEQDVYRITSKDLIEGKVSHPTVKPLGNIRDLMKHFVAEIVYEPFLGSGSTLIACEQTNRINFGLEIDPKYVDVCRKRYHKFVTGSEDGWEQATPQI